MNTLANIMSVVYPLMSSCEYCGIYVGTKMGQQMNVTTLYIHEYPVNVALGLCIAAAPDPAKGKTGSWWATCRIATHATKHRLKYLQF